MKSSPVSVLACDYDGTLCINGVVEPSTVDALERFTGSGRTLLLVSGRRIEELLDLFPLPKIFRRVVAENGAVIYNPHSHTSEVLGIPPPRNFIDSLYAQGIPELSIGKVVVSAHSDHSAKIGETIREMKIPYAVILNKDSAMVLPNGVDKGSGLKQVLKNLNLDSRATAAIGDAENDIELFRASGTRIAVANALPELKKIADVVMHKPEGRGVVEYIDSVLAAHSALTLR